PQATARTHTLSLYDALPISRSSPASANNLLAASALSQPCACRRGSLSSAAGRSYCAPPQEFYTTSQPYEAPAVSCTISAAAAPVDRKSTRLNSSHVKISYAV